MGGKSGEMWRHLFFLAQDRARSAEAPGQCFLRLVLQVPAQEEHGLELEVALFTCVN